MNLERAQQGRLEQRKSDEAELKQALEHAISVVEHSYLERLNSLELAPLSSEEMDIKLKKCGRLYHLTHVVYNKDEAFLDKLITVVNVAAALDGTLVTVIHSSQGNISYYLGILSKSHRGAHGKAQQHRSAVNSAFSGAILGNFVGSALKELSDTELDAVEEQILYRSSPGRIASIASVSGIVALRGKKEDALKGYVQGIENLTDALSGKDYTIMMIADPVSPTEIQSTIQGYEKIYTELSPFAQSQLTISEQGSLTLSNAQTKGVTQGITEGVSHTQSVGTSRGKNFGINAGAHVGVSMGAKAGINIGVNAGFYNGTSSTDTSGSHTDKSRQESEQKTKSVAAMLGEGKSVQVTGKDRTVQGLLEQIDQHIKRLNLCKSYGAFHCAAYVLSEEETSTLSAASIYSALIRGEESFIQTAQLGYWQRPTIASSENPKDFENLIKYLQSYTHPRFYLDRPGGVQVTPACLVSGQELAIQFGLPKKSIQGLTVTEMAAFGRNVKPVTGQPIRLGEVYHMGGGMGKELLLDADSLASHVFVTGSTGSGKSNAVYTLLDKLCLSQNSSVHFLVIEPAKGEYKEALGGYPGVCVFGTNPSKTQLLRLNPFSFPEDTHVLEHIDRLVELFNACWPMYAAMPAVLKAAIERAYVGCGWNLSTSSCHSELYPTFWDVMRALPSVVDSKGFSGDTQGDYKGALLMRLESLTNGINGQLLCAHEELPLDCLFDQNVIVDLSRVGSSETKALLMGVLILKLQEYRMEQRSVRSNCTNSTLRHITVLEEAHNLLRRIPFEQAQDGSNLQGKSVEMITNAIAEMRTYGEGFVIADQSPGLLDLAAIRNTNTKIILRLPDEGDRFLAGKAAGLNDSQITELSRLKTGVAAVFQNGWIEPVLCQADLFDQFKGYMYTEKAHYRVCNANQAFFQLLLCGQDCKTLSKQDKIYMRRWIRQLDTGVHVKRLLLNALDGDHLQLDDIIYALYCTVKGKRMILESENLADPETRQVYMKEHIQEVLLVSEDTADDICKAILSYVEHRSKKTARPDERSVK